MALFATTAAFAMNTFASEALNGFSPFQLVFVHDPPDLTSLIPQNRYYSCHVQRILQFIISQSSNGGRLVLEWRTQQALEFETKNRQFTKEEIFKDKSNCIFVSTTFFSIANKYNKIQTGFHWLSIHRYCP